MVDNAGFAGSIRISVSWNITFIDASGVGDVPRRVVAVALGDSSGVVVLRCCTCIKFVPVGQVHSWFHHVAETSST